MLFHPKVNTSESGSISPGAVAILGAMPEEVAVLLQALAGPRRHLLHGTEVHSGELEGVPVLVAVSGVGKVNAAATAQTLIMLDARALIFTGVAGALAPGLRTGDLLVGTDALQYDVDVTALGYERARIPDEPLSWSCAPELVELALASAADLPGVRVSRGRVATADRFLARREEAEALWRAYGALCVEMEGAAVAQVCARAGLPFVIVRSISDSADESAELSFREFTDLAAQRAKALVRGMLRRMGAPGSEVI